MVLPEAAVLYVFEDVLDELAVDELEVPSSGYFQAMRAETIDVAEESVR